MADNVYLKFGNSGRYLTYRDYNQTAANAEANDAWNALYVAIKMLIKSLTPTLPPQKS
jgi:hypothetical protein